MFEFSSSTFEAVPRVVIVYFALLVVLRLTGKRQLGQLSPMDILTLLLISETVSPALTAQDPSLVTGIIAAVTLVLCDLVVAVASYRSRRMEAVIEGLPSVLIKDGQLDTKVMRDERVSMPALEASLRKAGIASMSEVRLAMIETDGNISVLKLNN